MSPKQLAIFLLVACALAPGAGAVVTGTPKTHCEDPSEWWEHRYVVPTRTVILLPLDANVEDCNGDGTPADFDGHSDFAVGGAVLAVGPAAVNCWGEVPHHPAFPVVLISDDSGSGPVSFTVGADRFVTEPVADPPGCGDRAADERVACIHSCRVPFPPGIDGTYTVVIHAGAGGRIWTRE